ncbi:YrhB domain-containing protein [Alcaligenaceae bacterium A4P071]|nr:YrhB domain-containing protein [Alcaligenaceae bacterium B3P038]MDQ2148887.1 YrhB domain-containing protein [Alcaligenaceae bacterium C4P045]MDQ2186162.1 YrhB domain-containing protein [Alcaligenaceae bacterium A4P071]
MIDKQRAAGIADAYLEKIAARLDDPVEIIESQEKPEGWVFFYESKTYLETQNLSAMLAGNAPFLVSRTDGALHLLSTAKPLEDALAEALASGARPAPGA